MQPSRKKLDASGSVADLLFSVEMLAAQAMFTHATCLANFSLSPEKMLLFEGRFGWFLFAAAVGLRGREEKETEERKSEVIETGMQANNAFHSKYPITLTYWGIMGAGNVDEPPLIAPGIGLGRSGGGGGSRVPNEFVGFIGACCFRCRFGLTGRFLGGEAFIVCKELAVFTDDP